MNDAYYHFIDTGKLMPLVEASFASPEDSSLLKKAIEMLENHRVIRGSLSAGAANARGRLQSLCGKRTSGSPI